VLLRRKRSRGYVVVVGMMTLGCLCGWIGVVVWDGICWVVWIYFVCFVRSEGVWERRSCLRAM